MSANSSPDDESLGNDDEVQNPTNEQNDPGSAGDISEEDLPSPEQKYPDPSGIPEEPPGSDKIAIGVESVSSEEGAAQAVAGQPPSDENTDDDVDEEIEGEWTDEATARAFEGFMTAEEREVGRLASRLGDVIENEEDNVYDSSTAYNRVSQLLGEFYAFAMPRDNTDGIRQALHVYEPETGIYRPYGKEFVGEILQELIGSWISNHKLREILGHIERSNYINEDDLGGGETEIVVQNGIVDWETGGDREHTPDDVFLSRVEMPWMGLDVSPARWREFFETVVSEEHVETMFHIFSHCLVDDYPDEKAFLFVNDGGGGKSTTIEMWENALGEEQVSNETLRALSSTNDTYAEAELYGKRANFGAEMAAETQSQLEKFKALTGGDRISARFPYEGKFKFRNRASIVNTLNTMPEFDSDKDALWRRMVMITFPHNFEDGEMADERKSKQQLKDELLTEDALAGLLAASIEHTMQATDEDGEWFPDVEPMWERRKKIKASAEPVFDFQNSCIVEDEGGKIPIEEAHRCYRAYASAEGLSTGIEGRDSKEARKKFGKKLHDIQDLDFESDRRRFSGERKTAYIGLSFSSRGLQVLDDERAGEKILGSIEGQDPDSKGEADSEENSHADRKRAGAEVVAKGVIGRVNEQNESGATYRAIVSECRENRSDSDNVLDAIDRLEEAGEVAEDDGGVFHVVETGSIGSDDSNRRTVARGIKDSMSGDMDTVSVSAVEGKLNKSPLGRTEIELVLESMDADDHVILSDGDVALTESAVQYLDGDLSMDVYPTVKGGGE